MDMTGCNDVIDEQTSGCVATCHRAASRAFAHRDVALHRHTALHYTCLSTYTATLRAISPHPTLPYLLRLHKRAVPLQLPPPTPTPARTCARLRTYPPVTCPATPLTTARYYHTTARTHSSHTGAFAPRLHYYRAACVSLTFRRCGALRGAFAHAGS